MTQTATPTDLASQLTKLRAQEKTNAESEIRLKAELEGIERELKAAEAEALNKFGTKDLGELRALFQTFQQQDQQAISDYSQAVNARFTLLESINTRLIAHRAGTQPGR